MLVGLAIMFILDTYLSTYSKKIEKELGDKIEYDNFTRFFVILAWPAAVFIIIKNFPR